MRHTVSGDLTEAQNKLSEAAKQLPRFRYYRMCNPDPLIPVWP